MNRLIASITSAFLLVACIHERAGTQLSSIGNVDGDGAILQAVKHALSHHEQECPLELLTPSDSWRAADRAAQEVVAVKICGSTLCALPHVIFLPFASRGSLLSR